MATRKSGTPKPKGPTNQDLQDALMNIYASAYYADGSVSDLRDLQDTVVNVVEGLLPDASDNVDDYVDADDDDDDDDEDDDDEE